MMKAVSQYSLFIHEFNFKETIIIRRNTLRTRLRFMEEFYVKLDRTEIINYKKEGSEMEARYDDTINRVTKYK